MQSTPSQPGLAQLLGNVAATLAILSFMVLAFAACYTGSAHPMAAFYIAHFCANFLIGCLVILVLCGFVPGWLAALRTPSTPSSPKDHS